MASIPDSRWEDRSEIQEELIYGSPVAPDLAAEFIKPWKSNWSASM